MDNSIEISEVPQSQGTDVADSSLSIEQRKQHMQNALLAKMRKRKMIGNEVEKANGDAQGEASTSRPINNTSKSNKQEVEVIEDDEIVVLCMKSGRKAAPSAVRNDGNSKSATSSDKMEDNEESMRAKLLRRMATQALVREAKRSAQRAQTFGPQGWLKPRSLSTNKVFLAKTLQSVELDRREHEQRRNARERDNRKSHKNLEEVSDTGKVRR